jgi:DNA polymerase-3 subunit gamma/tau
MSSNRDTAGGAAACSKPSVLARKARSRIRPTRKAGPVETEQVDDRDAAADRRDSDLADNAESHTELLARHLGAEIIAEEDHGA